MTSLQALEAPVLLAAGAEYRNSFAAGLMPEDDLTVSQWSDDFRKLDSKSSPEPGDFRTIRTPYLREVMDSLSVTCPVTEVVVMKGAQLGFTEAANNFVGYVIHQAPGPGLFLEPSEDLANRNVRAKINPMIELTPELAALVPKPRSPGNTLEEKEFPSGIWMFKWASSTGGLRSSSMRYLVLDEIDEYAAEVGDQGSPESLARKRTNAFGARKKIYIPSTPTVEGKSRVAALYEDSDQRRYYMPAPCCGEMITFEFRNLKWPHGQPDQVHYKCQVCNGKIEHWQKTEMLERGEWVAENPANTRRRGYHLSSLYSPVGWQSWEEIAQDWEEAQGNTALLKAFVNTVLGETWKEKGEAPDWKRLYERREGYQLGVVPRGGLILTCGADVQRGPNGAGWIEVVTRAWGRNLENWVVDHQQFHGDTGDLSAAGGPWEKLRQYREKYFPHECSGVAMQIRMMAVDSGDQTQTVYQWCSEQPQGSVMAVKGSHIGATMIGSGMPIQIKPNGRRVASSIKLWKISLGIVKSELYAVLGHVPEPGKPLCRGYMHFPELDQEFFEQLTGEQLVHKRVKGRMTSIWEAMRSRVEVLDCTVYSRAAAHLLGLDHWKGENWEALEQELGIVDEDDDGAAQPETENPRPARRPSSYWNRR